ncbi:MAG: hypothetical protein ABR517_13985 [Thermoanaerobaculia bacterium]
MKMKLMNLTAAMTFTFLCFALPGAVPGIAGEPSGTGAEAERVQGENRAHDQSRNLVGSWETEVTIRDCQTGTPIRSFYSVGTFMPGGTMIDSTAGTPQELKTPGQGIWTHLDGHRYRLGFKSFTFDVAGNATGWTKIVHVATMDPTGDTYSSEGSLEVYAPSGFLVFTGCASATAGRYEY